MKLERKVIYKTKRKNGKQNQGFGEDFFSFLFSLYFIFSNYINIICVLFIYPHALPCHFNGKL